MPGKAEIKVAAADTAVRAEGMREAARIVKENAARIRTANTYRGKVNQIGDYAADQVDDAAAAILSAIGERRLPPIWQVGHRVRYIRDQGPFGPTIGTEGAIIKIREKDQGKPAGTYQVFWVRPDKAPRSQFWTTPDDVEWLASETASE